MTSPSPNFSQANRKLLVLLLFTILSCCISSSIGVLIGQAGGLLYQYFGGISALICLPSYCILFFATFVMAYLVNLLLNRIFKNPESR